MTDKLMPLMLKAAIAASKAIIEVYEQDFTHVIKADSSPVTEADTRAEEVILDMLGPTGLPVLAEESVGMGRIPELGTRFFIVDPLDGTKEFLKRNGEFTVNIALCEAGRPVLGVVLAPAIGEAYWGGPAGGFAAALADGRLAAERRIAVRTDGPVHVVGSRSHAHPAMIALCEKMNVVKDVSVGSSLKFCLLARGDAQLYPRFGPTSEWDTAAGQAVLEAAGGVVLGLDGKPLTCGHADRRYLNSGFAAAADRNLADAAIAEMRRLLA
ncbi:MAG: 3'(2'),5'-bisphosphate nucleotidase CysQ [Devosia sp.]|nr:3'(2'),5'-bisphosphate nucleotidase CysQ [Devosia sp.]